MHIIGALYDSGGDAIMNMSDTPIEKSKKIMDAKGFSEGKKGERNKRQQFVRAVSIFLFVLVISFVAVLVKAYFDGEFRSVAALQKYIGEIRRLWTCVSDGFSGNSSCYSCLTRLSWMCGRFGDVRSCCWVLV